MPATLRILSANLWNGRARPGSLEDVLSEVGADVVALQELSPNAAEIIAPRYRHGHLDPRTDYYGSGIGAVRPIRVERLDLPERSGWRGRLEPDDWPEISMTVDVFNVHLINPIEPPPWRSVEIRTGQVAGILDAASASDADAVVVVGDMNSSPAWPAYRRLTEQLTDGALAARTARRTWGPTASFPRLLRIDHVLTRGVTTVATSTIRIAGSDHSALIVDLEA